MALLPSSRAIDRILLFAALPAAALVVAIHVLQVAAGRPAWPAIAVQSEAGADVGRASALGGAHEDYPVVREVRAGIAPDVLRPGDRLLAAGSADLRAAGPFRARALLLAEADAGGVVALRRGRDGEVRTVELRLPAAEYPWWRGLVLGFAFLGAAALLLARAPGRETRALATGSLCYTLVWCEIAGGPVWMSALGVAIYAACALLVAPLVIRTAQLFPPEVALRGRMHAFWPWGLAVGGVFRIGMHVGGPLSYEASARGLAVYQIVTVIALVALLTRAFRRSGALGRRQIKWVVYSVYVGAVPYVAVTAAGAIWEAATALRELAVLCAVMLPIGTVIAIVRAQLFDIDRLISATASYSVTLMTLFGVALLGVQEMARWAGEATGIDAGSMQTVLSLAIVLIAIPAHRALRPGIEAIFFRERAALQREADELLRALAACKGADALFERLGEWLERLLRPESCVTYALAGSSFVPVDVRARAAPPAFDGDGPLATRLSTIDRALAIDALRLGRGAGADRARAALDTSGVRAILPIRRAGELSAFVCIGAKRSGDVYTETDLALLTAIAQKASSELQRFDTAEIRKRGLEMQASLRRYVPGAIADQLESGQELEPREREVSVLFVDIRGYTALSQDRRPEEIFSTVNRYTETVSRIVRANGGAVVEFNGDGMMAVFGAPAELPEKERAAVRAGLDIVREVAELEADGGVGAERERLRVGVGIATGPAFVGNIRAVDRLIWSAIGNTTNLAARLQSLTRDLDVAIVIDAPTSQRARPEAAGFEPHEAMPIRGRRTPLDVFTSPI